MKCIVEHTHLLQALKTLNKVIPSNPQLPILRNLHCSFKKDSCTLQATDLRIGFEIKIPIKDLDAPTQLLVDAKVLLDFVQTLQSGVVHLEQTERALLVRCNQAKAKLALTISQDYPSFDLELPSSAISIKTKQLQDRLEQVRIAVAADDTRPVLTGMYAKKTEKGSLVLVGTDGYRLSVVDSDITPDWSPDILIPAKALLLVVKEASTKTTQLGYDAQHTQLVVGQGSQSASIRLLTGDYPQYQKILPKQFATTTTIDKDELVTAVKQMAVFARESANIVRMQIGETLELSTKKGSFGSGKVAIECKTQGEGLLTAFNYRYLLDFLGVVGDGEITIACNDPKSPVQFTAAATQGFTHIIMPVDIKE